jgi:nucleotide-binding universal stress UspA family protein
MNEFCGIDRTKKFIFCCSSDLSPAFYPNLSIKIGNLARKSTSRAKKTRTDEKEREMLRVSVNKIKEKYKQIAVNSKEEMRAVISRLHAEDIEVDYLLHKGSPEKTIVEVADKLGVDLIVICTDGRDNIKDFVAGTITEHVINTAGCPVLVIHFKK